MLIKNIKWDTDGDMEALASLPIKGCRKCRVQSTCKNGQKSASLKKLKIVKTTDSMHSAWEKYLNHLKKGVAGYLC